MPRELLRVRLDAPAALLPSVSSFYRDRLGFPLTHVGTGSITVAAGGTELEVRGTSGRPFYHVAFLVPGDRFDDALGWACERVELLTDVETGEPVFDFANWDAEAVYFHDPAGSIIELIAHHGIGQTGATGPFSADELLGLSEVGLVGDPPALAASLRQLGLEVWDGTVDGESRLAFVGEKARTLILCRPGRPWLPTGRLAEAHPVEVTVSGASDGTVLLGDGGRVTVRAS